MDDKALVKRILAGDRDAFAMLISRHQRLVEHMVYRLIDDPRDRQEIVQDVFVKVYQKISEFKFDAKLSTWIAVIAYRQAVNSLKKNSKWSNEDDLDDINFQLAADHPTIQYESENFSTYIHQCIEKLPPVYKTILTLFHLEEKSYPEIVEIMDMPEGTVKNYLFRARKKLKEHVTEFMRSEMLLT